MKYRVLNKSELEPLNEEFLKYLLVANITPEVWEQLKQKDPQACQTHIETFSDLVFDKVLKDLNYISVVGENRVEVYQALKEYVLMFSLENKEIGSFNFKTNDWSKLNIETVNILKGKKVYKDREQELFEILQRENAGISDGELFKKIALLSVSNED